MKHHNEPGNNGVGKKNIIAKWLTVSGIIAITSIIIALPIIKDSIAYGHDLVTAPAAIKKIQEDQKGLQKQIDEIQQHEIDTRIWQTKVDDQLNNLREQNADLRALVVRVLNNQETSHYGAPHQQPP